MMQSPGLFVHLLTGRRVRASMNAVPGDPRPQRALRETFGFAALAAILYAMTWQSAVHGTDWRWFVLLLDEPGAVHLQHPGYFVVAHALWTALHIFDLDAYGVLRVMSILGGAFCVAGIHRLAMTVNGDRRFAGFAAALAMVSPALWHHATVVELHAAFAAVMVWALLCAVSWTKNGRLRDAVLTGVLSGAAAVMHATGHLLVVLVAAAIAWHCRQRGMRSLLRQIAVFALVHLAVWGASFVLIRTVGHPPRANIAQVEATGTLGATDPFDYVLRSLDSIDLARQAWPTLLHEWLQPYAPLSALLVVAVFFARQRRSALLLHAILLVYLAATMTLVQAWTDERGAYLLPLLAPGILITLQVVRRRWWPALFVGTLACGVLFRGEPGREVPDRVFGQAAAAMAAEQSTVFVVAEFPEMDGAFVVDPRLDIMVALELHGGFIASTGRPPTAPEAIAGVLAGALKARQRGARFVVTDRAVEWMSQRVDGFAALWSRLTPAAVVERLPTVTGIEGLIVDPGALQQAPQLLRHLDPGRGPSGLLCAPVRRG